MIIRRGRRDTSDSQVCLHLVIENGGRFKPNYAPNEMTSFLCGNRNGPHRTELRTSRHIIQQHKKLKIN